MWRRESRGKQLGCPPQRPYQGGQKVAFWPSVCYSVASIGLPGAGSGDARHGAVGRALTHRIPSYSYGYGGHGLGFLFGKKEKGHHGQLTTQQQSWVPQQCDPDRCPVGVKLDAMHLTLADLRDAVKAQNGRVRDLERWRWFLTGGLGVLGLTYGKDILAFLKLIP